MLISWVALVIPLIRTWRMTWLRRLTPTICAFHLGFSLVWRMGSLWTTGYLRDELELEELEARGVDRDT